MKRFVFSSLKSLYRDNSGAALIEFALLGPLLITMMIGVFHMGVYMQNYNAIRSLTSDGARFAMIEYQKGNELTNVQIEAVLLATAVNAPYNLDTDRITVSVKNVATGRVTGARELDVDIGYTLEDWLPFVKLPATTLTYTRPIFVVDAPVGT